MQRAMAELWFSNRGKNGRTLNRHDDGEKQLRHYEWARRRLKAVQPLDPANGSCACRIGDEYWAPLAVVGV